MVTQAHPIMLIADDDPGFRSCLARRFRRRGFKIIEAADGPSALEEFQNSSVDVAIIDYDMPGLKGTEVLERLDTDWRQTHSTHVVMLTGLIAAEHAAREALELGCVNFLRKPIPLAAVEQIINDAIVSDVVALAQHSVAG